MNETSILKDILVPISTIVSLISVAIGTLVAVFTYRVNLRAETRLKESAKAEIDTKLLELMAKLIQKANGRSGYETSHDAIKKVLENTQIQKVDLLKPENVKVVNRLLTEISVLRHPVGSAEQDFAIKAIGELGLEHEFLRSITIESIKELSKMKRTQNLCWQVLEKLEARASRTTR